MESGFDSIIKANLRYSRVPRFRKMGVKAANNVMKRLSDGFPLEDRGSQLIHKLANRKYKEALSFLEQNLPDKIIGYRFDRLECHILDLLSAEEAVSLFIQFGQHANRAFNMWHNYYKYDNVKAVKLLDMLANKDWEIAINECVKGKGLNLKLLKSAYLGHLSGRLRMQKMETPIASNMLKISRENNLYLPISLLMLRSPLIMHAVRELDIETISNLFIERFVRDEGLNVYEVWGFGFMLKSLGNKKAFNLYSYLVKNKIIEASELDKQFPDEAALVDAKEGHIPDKIIRSIQDRIDTARLNRIELEAQRSKLWNLLHWQKNK